MDKLHIEQMKRHLERKNKQIKLNIYTKIKWSFIELNSELSTVAYNGYKMIIMYIVGYLVGAWLW